MKQVGVYTVRHSESGELYIGSTNDFAIRRCNHLSTLRRGVHCNEQLQAAFTDETTLDWTFAETASREEAYRLEGLLIESNIDNPLLCNRSVNPKGNDGRSFRGKTHSEESLAKMSAAKQGVALSDEHRASMSASRTGKTKTAEWSDKIADSVRKEVVVNGVVYRSATEAAIAHNTSATTVLHRARNPSPRFAAWQLSTE